MPEDVKTVPQTDTLDNFRYNNEAMRQAFEHKKASDPAFKDVTSFCAYSRKFGISESTCKRIFGGRANDFTVSILWFICKTLSLDPAVVLYLPTSKTGADVVRIAALEERDRQNLRKIEELQSEIERKNAYEKELRERLLTISDSLAREKEKSAELSDVKGKKRALAICLLISVCLFIAFAGMSVYFLWELQNPQSGNWQY